LILMDIPMETLFRLTLSSVADYIKQILVMNVFFQGADQLQCEELSEGNVNLIFRVYTRANRKQSVIIKQALPYAQSYPDVKNAPKKG
jgi:5-methylthioribose kinase